MAAADVPVRGKRKALAPEPPHSEPMALSRIKPYDRNPRINDQAVDAVARSIREFGFRQPIVVDERGMILAGHTRYKAAVALGLATVPVHVARGLSPAKRRAYRIADNATGARSSWDPEALAEEIGALKSDGLDLGLLGFADGELARLLANGEEESGSGEAGDEAGEAPSRAKVGDLWRLGRHTLACGNSSDRDLARRAMRRGRPQIMVTDPPYGVEYDPAWRKRAGINRSDRMGEVFNDARASWTKALTHFPGAVAYVWHAGRFAAAVSRFLEGLRFEIRSQIIWVKRRFAISRGQYHWRHEPCWYAVRSGAAGAEIAWSGSRRQQTVWSDIVDRFESGGEAGDLYAAAVDGDTVYAFEGSRTTVWDIAHDKGELGRSKHSTQKPVECMARPMQNHDLARVYDPFVGSGTTILAAEQLGRSCAAVELNPRYVDVALARWERLTGEKARRER